MESVINMEPNGSTKTHHTIHMLFNLNALPLYASFVSVLILLYQAAYYVSTKLTTSDSEVDGPPQRMKTSKDKKIHKIPAILWLRATRFLGCLLLTGLSAVTTRMLNTGDKWTQSLLPAVFLYTSLLSAVSVLGQQWSSIATLHLDFVLFMVFGVYVYRDLWPLLTTNETPEDIAEGPLLWVKLAILTIAAVFVPLFIPRQYVPINPNGPIKEPSPDTTASIVSKYLYLYLDHVIFKASKLEHLSLDELPPQAEGYRAQYLKENGFPHIDTYSGAKQRHLFFKLLRVFRTEYIVICMHLLFQVIVSFGAPIGINRILSFFENGRDSSNLQPWFWAIWIFLGPMTFSISRQAYIFICTGIAVRTESLITQLIFEHCLRIRLKAEASGSELTAVVEQNGGDGTDGSASQANSSAVTKKKATRADNMIGKINNFVTTDLNSLYDGKDFLLVGLYTPLQILAAMFFLYKILGVSALIGLFIMLVSLRAPELTVKKLDALGAEKMKLTDARVQIVAETVNILRMVKMFAWESKMGDNIQQKRKEELALVWKSRLWSTFIGVVNQLLVTLVMLATYGFYTVVMKKELTASIIFSTMPVFELLRSMLYMLTASSPELVQGKISLDRLSEFLQNTELLDAYAPIKDQLSALHDNQNVVGFKDCSFSWSKESEGAATPSYRLRIEGQLEFQRGCINLITGPTGTGKTSMLMALLGEMHFIPTTADSWFNLPRGGGVAYAAQESWVLNDTIRNNVLFGCPFDEARYHKVLHQCALKQDLELFEAGDQTEVGERGLTLSGGQKARITLARAVYSSAEIILLDDTLAALDAHISRWIVEECLLGDLIKGRTVLLVTHNVSLARPTAHFHVSIGLNGSISAETLTSLDHLPESLAKDIEDIATDADDTTKSDGKEAETKTPDGKLIVAEEIAKGRVGWKAFKLFLTSLGGKHPTVFFTVWLTTAVIFELMHSFNIWYLGYWGSQYERQPGRVQASYYLSVYSLLQLLSCIVEVFLGLYYTAAIMRASRTIHSLLMRSILGTTLRWLDETPVARIITRCTQDIAAVDGAIAQIWKTLVTLVIASITKLGLVVIITPIFLVLGIILTAVGIYIGIKYLKVQLSVRREKSNAKAPILAHFSVAVAGLVSVRAYGVQEAFKQELRTRIDRHARASKMTYDINRWMTVRTDFFGAFFVSALALYFVLTQGASAVTTGFSLAMALDFSQLLLHLVMLYNEMQVQANSLERIQSYVEIEQEKQPTTAGKPPAAWPTSGELRVENLSARYSANGPEILHRLSFQICSGERVGVVGRTGSGKSTLTLSLLRCIPTEGHVFYDGVATDQINLEALRSNITIIPQVPELLSGTLRRNLDPFGERDDAELNAALKYAGLFSLQSESDDARITLDTKIASGGGNLSVGQRQIIALARAMVRESKLLILDEATSAIDYKTDVLVQDALRTKLGSDVTVITIAHRLQTIMDADKIMVLDSGNLVEFDTPVALLQKEGGIFKGLVDNSGDAAALRAVAFAKTSQ